MNLKETLFALVLIIIAPFLAAVIKGTFKPRKYYKNKKKD